MSEADKKDRIVRIKYEYDHMTDREGKSLAASICIFLLIIIMACELIWFPKLAYVYNRVPVEIAIAVLVLIGTLVTYIIELRKRMAKKNHAKMIKKNGTKVIGEITNMNTTEVKGDDENFSYNIEYENPFNHKASYLIFTPYAIHSEMYIREKDLPLKVIIYCYNNMTHIDAVINPPLAKMAFRKYGPPIFIFIAVILFGVSGIGTALNNPIMSITSLITGFILSLIAVYFFVFD